MQENKKENRKRNRSDPNALTTRQVTLYTMLLRLLGENVTVYTDDCHLGLSEVGFMI